MYFLAGVKNDSSQTLVTAGGRICGLTTVADTIESARKECYQNLSQISFEGEYFRQDIGQL